MVHLLLWKRLKESDLMNYCRANGLWPFTSDSSDNAQEALFLRLEELPPLRRSHPLGHGPRRVE